MTDEHKAPGKPRAVLTLNGRPLPGKPVIATPGTPMPRAISSVNGKDRPRVRTH
jgi:ATP-dependent Clp protease protease subunit